MQNSITTLEDSLAVSYKNKQTLSISYDSAIVLLCAFPNDLKMCIHTKNLHMNVYRSSIHSCPSISINKLWYIHNLDGILYSNKRK